MHSWLLPLTDLLLTTVDVGPLSLPYSPNIGSGTARLPPKWAGTMALFRPRCCVYIYVATSTYLAASGPRCSTNWNAAVVLGPFRSRSTVARHTRWAGRYAELEAKNRDYVAAVVSKRNLLEKCLPCGSGCCQEVAVAI